MFPLNPKPSLSVEEYIEKVVKLKPQFDKLNTYKAKLEFWDRNGLNIGVTTYGISDEIDKRDLPENNITIYPENNNEIKAYKKFYHTLFRNYSFNSLDALTDKYWKKIEQGADPIPYTKKQIVDIDAYYESNKKNFRTSHNTLRSYANGFEASQNGVIEDFLNSNYFRENLLSYFTGEVDEKYRRFLVQQLKQLEKGKPTMFDVQEKLHISCRLLGDNKPNTSQLDYYHIPYILNYFNISPKEAREVLLFSKGAFTPKINIEIVEKIVAHIERVYPEVLIHSPQPIDTTEYQSTFNGVINPTHNFELLKPVRQQLFEQEKQDFITERKEKKLPITAFELNSFYVLWLEKELKVIEQWLSDTYPKGEKKKFKQSASTQIEIKKYKDFVTKEIKKTETLPFANKKVKPEQKSKQSTTTRYALYVNTYNNFTRNKKYKHDKAVKATCEKHGISFKTLDRAIKQI